MASEDGRPVEVTPQTLRAFFALTRAINVAPADIEQFIAERLNAKKARATVNRETGAFEAGVHLA